MLIDFTRRQAELWGVDATDRDLITVERIRSLDDQAEEALASLFRSGEATIPVLTLLVPESWRFKEPVSHIPTDMWREMFRQIPYTVDFRVTPRPTRPLTLFRGATPQNREGIAWTLSLRQARYFAQSRQAPGTRDATVWVCRVPADRMLARIKEQSFEHEIVADVRGLDIREAEPLSWWHRQMVHYRKHQGIS